MNGISLVIPTLNEEGNILNLVERIDKSLKKDRIPYEIIFVDDHSTDQTLHIIQSIAGYYPLSVYKKEGNPGKAYSLIEGFKKARFDILGMIDADLQYQPEALNQMVIKIVNGSDVVVANRIQKNLGKTRKFTSNVFKKVFGKYLHDLNYDVQSGLKVFKKDVFDRIEINPTPWTFDLEFLVKAKNAGFVITSVDIDFIERVSGHSKVSVLKTSYEIGTSAVKTKLQGLEPIPFSKEMEEKLGKGFHYKGRPFVHHSNLHPSEMAFFRLNNGQISIMFMSSLFLLIFFIFNWYLTAVSLIILLTALYFVDIFFNLFLIIRSFYKTPELKVTKAELNNVSEKDWPMYTIFCPLYNEWRVIPQFVTAMSRLDYPKDKLQVMLILEEDDKESQENIKNFDLPSYFEVVVVPDSLPKTKPKACNYGLGRAKGEYIVIYDAEDIPDPLQLKKAILAFQKAGDKTVCIQAKLNFYNPHHNILTRVFTAEYSLWFDLILTGLQSINAPIPLGGTSNHFRTKDLIELKGWDAFNVTEDCDLGMRLVKKGFNTAIVDSTTHEEANSDYTNWFGQRSRWIKGYIQSYFVHMRRPKEFTSDLKHPHLLLFQLIVGGKILSMFTNPLLWIVTFSYFAFRPYIGVYIEHFFPGPLLYFAVFSAVVGNFLYFYYYMIACAKKGYFDLILFGFLVPIYWAMMSYATWIAIYKIITQPHYWYKTKHGLHMNSDKALEANDMIGRNLVDTNLAGVVA